MISVRALTGLSARRGLRFLLCGLGLALAALTASCGNDIFIVGTPVLTLTADPGRFTTYIVTIDEIEMTRKDGTIIELPTIDERVDLAHLNSFANLLEVPAVGQGTYVSATFVLDYSSAVIGIDVGGQTVQVTKLLDAATSAVPTTTTVTVKFDPNNPLVITNQASSLAAFSIDLETSNSIAWTASDGPQVTVQPFWEVTTQPTYADRPVFARGLYVYAQPSQNFFVMNVRPLHDILDNPFGGLTVNVSDTTYYQINGTTYVGAAGLAALNALKNTYADLQIGVYGPPTGSPFGNLGTNPPNVTPSFTATQVYVGTSLESTIEDGITGTVEQINNDGSFVVEDAALVDRLGDYAFQQIATVTTAAATVYSQDGVNSQPTFASLSVGQVVTVQGQVTVDASGNPTSLDATSASVPGAQVRLQNTPLWGIVNSAGAGTLSLNMLVDNYYGLTYLNFAGTGTSTANDATTGNYIIDTSAVTNNAAPAAGSVARVDGFATPFGSGPPYFTASAVTPVVEQKLVLEWAGNGSLAPFTTTNGTAIVVNLQDQALLADDYHEVDTGPIVSATNPFALGPTQVNVYDQPNQNLLYINLTPPTTTPNVLYGVGDVVAGQYLFSDPQSFANQVQIVVNGAVPVRKLTAWGTYDASTGTFTATKVIINAVQAAST